MGKPAKESEPQLTGKVQCSIGLNLGANFSGAQFSLGASDVEVPDIAKGLKELQGLVFDAWREQADNTYNEILEYALRMKKEKEGKGKVA